MLESLKSRGGKRWPRGQKFALSARGVDAEASYREAIAAARSSGRSNLEEAQRAWAAPLAVQPHDGVVLGELRTGKKSIAEIARALEDCGTSQPEVKAAIDRLTDALLVDAVAMGSQADEPAAA
jgi:hypothetical protein